MGNGGSRAIADEFATAIKTRSVQQVDEFLGKVALAKAGETTDRGGQAFKDLDLNALCMQGPGWFSSMTPLHLAASIGCPDMVRLLLDAPSRCPRGCWEPVDIDRVDGRSSSALHYGAGSAAAGAARCVQELLEGKANPFLVNGDGCTALDLARQKGPAGALTAHALEGRVALWRNWCDYEEKVLGAIPRWTPKWLVVLRDRRPNAGPRGCTARQVVCNSCRQSVAMLPNVERVRCTACGLENEVAVSLQIALYEASVCPTSSTEMLDASKAPILINVPSTQYISATKLGDASIKNVWDSLVKGKLRNSLQSAIPSSRQHGVSVKMLDLRGAVQSEHCFRVPTEAERDRLLHYLEDPIRASMEAAQDESAPPTPSAPTPTPSAPLMPPQPEPSAPPASSLGLPSACAASMEPEAERGSAAAARAARAALIDVVGQVKGKAPAPASGEQAGAADSTCVICMERQCDAAVIPCGHMCGCLQCLQALQSSADAQCPMCRGPLQSAMRIFRSVA